MTQTDTWGAAISGTQEVEETPIAVKVFSFLQIVVAVLAMIMGGAAFYTQFNLFIAERIPLVGLLGTLFIVATPLIVIGFLMIRVAMAVRILESWSFPWVIMVTLF